MIYALYTSCIQQSFLAWMLVVDVFFSALIPRLLGGYDSEASQSEDLPSENEDFAATKNGSATSDVKT